MLYTALLVGFIYRARHTLYRGQAVALVLGITSPIPLNLIFLSGMVEFDTTPIGFIVASAWFALAIVRYEYTNITPVAREKVIANVRDGMLVVDTNNKVVDSNPAAREMLSIDGSAVGTTAANLVDSPRAVSVLTELTAEEGERTISYGELWLRVESSPIHDDRDRHVGWLLLLEDVTERIRRERDLEQQIEKLDQFTSLVSHDLRNPINVASGYIEQTKATGDLSHLDKVQEATERMEAIIEDALELAREGQDVTDLEEISLEGVTREAWETVETDGAQLVVERDVQIVADEARLKRLFENLYRNAVEHGASEEESAAPDPSGLVVTVAVEDETPTDLTIVCSDNGTGIPPEHVDQVLEGGFTTNREGTGLGLAIVDQIANAHDWGLNVGDSDTGGARFEIRGVRRPL